MEPKKRKSPRISGYDYSLPNSYFITVCTCENRCLFGEASALNQYGRIAEKGILKIPEIYPQVLVDKFVVMPNHVHMILTVEKEAGISIASMIGQYKMAVTKQIHKWNPDCKVWQRSFHDHIIRNQKSYEKIWEYIQNNPLKWDEDCFYTEDS